MGCGDIASTCYDIQEQHLEVTKSSDDFLWIQLSLIRRELDDNSEPVTYSGLQVVILVQYGELHFNTTEHSFLSGACADRPVGSRHRVPVALRQVPAARRAHRADAQRTFVGLAVRTACSTCCFPSISRTRSRCAPIYSIKLNNPPSLQSWHAFSSFYFLRLDVWIISYRTPRLWSGEKGFRVFHSGINKILD